MPTLSPTSTPLAQVSRGGDISMKAHEQWASRPADQRFQTLESLYSAVDSRRMRSRALDVDCSRIKVELRDNGTLAVNSVIEPSEPSHWSFGQLAQMVKAPAAYLRTLPKPLLVNCLNHGVESGVRDAVKFMTVESENEGVLNTLQAVTSPTYGRIWDADCVKSVMRIVERSGGKFYNPRAYVCRPEQGKMGFSAADTTQTEPAGLYASDRDVFMFLIDGGSRLDVGPRAQLNRGFIVKNSEVGASTFTLDTFWFNQCCGNNIIYGAQNVTSLAIRHTSGGPDRFSREALPALMNYTQASASDDEALIRRAIEFRLPGDTKQLDALLKPFDFSSAERSRGVDFAKSEEGKCESLWDLVQGLTAYARGFEYMDARVNLEKRAGKLLNLVSNN